MCLEVNTCKSCSLLCLRPCVPPSDTREVGHSLGLRERSRSRAVSSWLVTLQLFQAAFSTDRRAGWSASLKSPPKRRAWDFLLSPACSEMPGEMGAGEHRLSCKIQVYSRRSTSWFITEREHSFITEREQGERQLGSQLTLSLSLPPGSTPGWPHVSWVLAPCLSGVYWKENWPHVAIASWRQVSQSSHSHIPSAGQLTWGRALRGISDQQYGGQCGPRCRSSHSLQRCVDVLTPSVREYDLFEINVLRMIELRWGHEGEPLIPCDCCPEKNEAFWDTHTPTHTQVPREDWSQIATAHECAIAWKGTWNCRGAGEVLPGVFRGAAWRHVDTSLLL